MAAALWLLTVLGVLGAFDTAYYHEWRARLPARGRAVASELKLHAARDFFYALLFTMLPWLAFRGAWVLALAGILVAETVLTMWDFIVETTERKPFGDVYAGERVTHNIMAITYGAMIACLLPTMLAWWHDPTALVATGHAIPPALRWVLSLMGAGVFLSGCRDLYAALELPGSHWPWAKIRSTVPAK
jgi:hypothetical protein